MAREFIAIPNQIVQPGASVIFEGEGSGSIYHRDGSGLFRLASPSVMGNNIRSCGCCCSMPVADYLVAFHGNVQIPTGGTIEQISLALVTDSEIDASGIMLSNPAAVEEPDNVGTGIIDTVPWICRCSSVALRNTSTQPIQIVNGNLIIDPSGVRR